MAIQAGRFLPTRIIGNAGISINVASVTGASGIRVATYGTGSVTIDATGDVSGSAGAGISVSTWFGGDVSIDTSNVVVTGRDNGILTSNFFGSGTYGISISAGQVSTQSGAAIGATTPASGDIDVTATGRVESTSGTGVMIHAGSSATLGDADVAINVAGVVGASGIDVTTYGTGSVTIDPTGDVSGTVGAAISVSNKRGGDIFIRTPKVVVTGGNAGISAAILRTGSHRISIAAGRVSTRSGTAIDARSSAAGDIDVTATGQVESESGAAVKILAVNSVSVNVASVTGASGIGVTTHGTGSVTINPTGAVSGSAGAGISVLMHRSGDIAITTSNVKVVGGTAGISTSVSGTGSHGISISAGEVSTQRGAGIGAITHAKGDIAITATGRVESTFGTAVIVQAGARGVDSNADVAINVARITGATGIDVRTFGTGSVTIDPTGDVSGTVGAAISVSNERGGDIFVTTPNVMVTGGTAGISTAILRTGSHRISISVGRVSTQSGEAIGARSSASGDISIAATGRVESTSGTAVMVVAGSSGSVGNADVAVNVASVAGASGIDVTTYGTGSVTIDPTGDVSGSAGSGIVASNTGGGDIFVTTSSVTVTGGDRGISAAIVNAGSGGISIVAGVVTATTGHAIYAKTSATADLKIVATGRVESASGTAIMASAGSIGFLSVADVTISAVTAKGSSGIDARKYGAGSITIDVTGMIEGSSGAGIYARTHNEGHVSINASSVTVAGGNKGIGAKATGTGRQTVSILASSVTSQSGYALGAQTSSSGTVAVTALGSIRSSSGYGIKIRANTGSAAGGSSVTVSAGSVTGTAGIHVENLGVGALTIDATGDVTGSSKTGVYAKGDGGGHVLISTTGSVHGSSFGMDVIGEGTASITINAASVSGMTGINLNNRGTGGVVVNVATVSGGIQSINENGGSIFITASGSVSGGLNGIMANNTKDGKSISIRAESIQATGPGIDAKSYGTGDLDISATTVSGGSNHGIFASGKNGGSIRITVTGTVSGNSGIYALNGSVDSSVTVSVGAVTGIFRGIHAVSQGSGGITISAASVTSEQSEGFLVRGSGGGSISITASGAVSGASYGMHVEDASSGVDITITAASVSGASAIRADHHGSGTLSIVATGDVSGSGTGSSIAISAISDKGDIVISAGSVTASGRGILASATGVQSQDVAISAGTVSASGTAIQVHKGARGSLTITATGNVESVTGTAVDLNLSVTRTGLETDVTVSVASLAGSKGGIYALGVGANSFTFVATGDVTSTEGNAVDLRIGGNGFSARVDGDVTSGRRGVSAVGTGGLISVEVKGSVTATGSSQGTGSPSAGIYVRSLSGSGISINAAAVSDPRNFGIWAENWGSGTTSISVTGAVTALWEDLVERRSLQGRGRHLRPQSRHPSVRPQDHVGELGKRGRAQERDTRKKRGKRRCVHKRRGQCHGWHRKRRRCDQDGHHPCAGLNLRRRHGDGWISGQKRDHR